jgi:hypothetical protein
MLIHGQKTDLAMLTGGYAPPGSVFVILKREFKGKVNKKIAALFEIICLLSYIPLNKWHINYSLTKMLVCSP